MDVLKGKPGMAAMMALAVTVTGCGGGGGSSSVPVGGSGGPGSPQPGDSLPALEGLSSAAGNDNWLYYTSDAENNRGLFAINPLMPDDGAKLIDGDAYLNVLPYVFMPIHSGDLVDTQLSNYKASRVFYRTKEDIAIMPGMPTLPQPDAFKRVSVSQSPQPASPDQVSSENNANNLNATQFFFQNDLSNPLNTAVAYRVGDQWWQLRVGDGAGEAPESFDSDHRVMVPLGDGDPNGWLAIDEANDNQLVQLDMSLSSQGAVLNKSGQPVDNLQYVQMLAPLSLTEKLLVLTFEDPNPSDEQEPDAELWLYSQGTIIPLFNDQDETLTFAAGLFGEGASLPTADQLVIRDDVLYFAFSTQSDTDILFSSNPRLYRVDNSGWSLEIDYAGQTDDGGLPFVASPFLIDAGDKLVWLIGDELTSIDLVTMTETPLYEGSISTPITDSENGWIFYNDQRGVDAAVAARSDGAESIRLNNARWIGAASKGAGSALSRRAKAEISEVFLLKDDGTIGAVSAAQPDNGMVTLGALDPAPVGVTMFGRRSGPHQLMQVEYSEDAFGMVYVNTEESNSLRHLMTEKAQANNSAELTRPVYRQ